MENNKTQGFTLIEMLVVIAIISILIGIGVTAFTFAQKKAQEARVQADFKTMRNILEQRRITEYKSLGELTLNYCSNCSCDSRGGVTFVTDSRCVNVMNTSWQNLAGEPMPKDPWGNPYLMDENENEGYYGPCRQDAFYTAGPDHISGTADDIFYILPLGVSC